MSGGPGRTWARATNKLHPPKRSASGFQTRNAGPNAEASPLKISCSHVSWVCITSEQTPRQGARQCPGRRPPPLRYRPRRAWRSQQGQAWKGVWVQRRPVTPTDLRPGPSTSEAAGRAAAASQAQDRKGLTVPWSRGKAGQQAHVRGPAREGLDRAVETHVTRSCTQSSTLCPRAPLRPADTTSGTWLDGWHPLQLRPGARLRGHEGPSLRLQPRPKSALASSSPGNEPSVPAPTTGSTPRAPWPPDTAT